MPVAYRKGTFRWQLVANREVPGSRDVTYPCQAKEATQASCAARTFHITDMRV